MAEFAKEDTLYKDFMAVPFNMIAEILNGKLVTSSLPWPRENYTLSCLGAILGQACSVPLEKNKGWLILAKPEIRLSKDIIVPLIAGWKPGSITVLPDDYFETPPDWVCEVLSPSTARYDRLEKRDIYAAHKVSHLWFIDPEARTLEAFELRDGQWVLLKTYGHDVMVDAKPFDAVPFKLGSLWFD